MFGDQLLSSFFCERLVGVYPKVHLHFNVAPIWKGFAYSNINPFLKTVSLLSYIQSFNFSSSKILFGKGIVLGHSGDSGLQIIRLWGPTIGHFGNINVEILDLPFSKGSKPESMRGCMYIYIFASAYIYIYIFTKEGKH